MQTIDIADLLLIAEAATHTSTDQLQREINIALVEAALAAAFSGVSDQELFPTDHEKIAVLGYRLARYHPLPDGNKRTAYAAMIMLASLNGYEWNYPSEDESVDTMLAVAAGTMTEDEFAAWIAERLQERP
jgi:death-on-curing protein